MNMQKWTVWSLDVWGNTTDGFEVNDRSKVGSIELMPDCSDRAVIVAMVAQGFLRSARFKFHIDGDDQTMEIDHAPTGRPLFSLELER